MLASSQRGGEEESKGKLNKTQSLSHYTNAQKNTGSNAVMIVESREISEGDEIGVFSSSGLLVGSGMVEEGRVIVTVWSDNSMTEEIDGATEGEELHLSIWKKEGQEESKLSIARLEEVLSGKLLMNELTYQSDGVYKVEVEKELQVPTTFTLEQNYPNPFNPSTTFRYSIPQTSKVVIRVYAILGNEIATLIDEEKSVGIYELTWNAENLPSGVYFYQLKAGDFIQTKKMILMK